MDFGPADDSGQGASNLLLTSIHYYHDVYLIIQPFYCILEIEVIIIE